MRGTTLLLGLAGFAVCNAHGPPRSGCPGPLFRPVTAAAAVRDLNPGWNLGNTLDAVPDEGSWGNVAQPSTFDFIKKSGFKSVRIPVTWAYHFDTESPSWEVNSAWLDRVETVVDQALDRGLSVVLNVHHDSWIWADVTKSDANVTMIEEKFTRLWAQIGEKFKCKSSKLIFEPINEFPGSTQEHGDVLNKLQDIFLDEINKAGGNNPRRVVTLTGLGEDSIKTSQFFKRGTAYPNQPWALQFHYYSPYDFIFGAWGKTIWGSDADKAALELDFSNFRNFTDVPVVIGEWEANETTEPAARWKYFDFFLRTATKYGFSTILWDNGSGHLNRTAQQWYSPVEHDVHISAARGISNALADSTTDPAATTQESSAFIYHKVGDPVVAQSVSYALNGNSIRCIEDSAGRSLRSSYYSVSGGVVTFSAAYLGRLFPASATPGTKETLMVRFSRGASLSITIVLWDTPTVETNTYPVDPSRDLYIPIEWKGLNRPAAVKAVFPDGTFLADDWTIWLGPLQQGRWTYGNWGYKDGMATVWASGLQAIKSSGKNVTLTFEAFPRISGENAVNITITQ